MQRSYLDYAMSVIVGRALPEVRDGLKPVHRRVIYAMYDGGYRPEPGLLEVLALWSATSWASSTRHGDSAIYDALVRLVQPWSLRYPLALGQGNFGSPGNDGAAAPRYTETKMAPLALEMVRDIEEETVDFQDNYDGRTQEPSILPSRFPNLLVNGSVGIAVGMATTSRRTTSARSPRAPSGRSSTRTRRVRSSSRRSCSAIKGPDFPTGAQILGTRGIVDAYRTGRGSITMRAVVNVEEIQGRTCLVVTEVPYQVTRTTSRSRSPSSSRTAVSPASPNIRDETSGRTGQRLVIVLKRDASPRSCSTNLYKHTQLQENFGANMLAIVDGCAPHPRARRLHLGVGRPPGRGHRRRTQFRLREAEKRAHILRGYLAGARRPRRGHRPHPSLARRGGGAQRLMELLSVDEIQARAILELQLRRLAALERQKIHEEAGLSS